MKNIQVLFLIFGVQCFFALIAAQDTRWLLTSRFSPQELVNSSAHQRHELLLKSLSRQSSNTLRFAFEAEIFAKSIRADFFGLTENEMDNRENTAIVEAAIECFTQLKYHKRVSDAMQLAIQSGIDAVPKTRNITQVFSTICSKIDDNLKNETLYTTKKAEIKKHMDLSQKQKVYQYEIVESLDEFRTSLAELLNDLKRKKLWVHFIFVFFDVQEDVVISNSVLEMTGLPGKLEPLQKIYETSINEVTSLVKDFNSAEVDLSMPLETKMSNWRPTLNEKLLSKIRENPDLKKDFEPIYKRLLDADPSTLPQSWGFGDASIKN